MDQKYTERDLTRLIYNQEATVSQLKRESNMSDGFMTYRGHTKKSVDNRFDMETKTLNKYKKALADIREENKKKLIVRK